MNTFDNFVVLDSNKDAYRAARAIAAQPGGQFNPLFLYSKPGLGKTHLLDAIANEVKQSQPNCNIISVTGEQLVQEVIESIRFNTTTDLRRRYREAALFIVDGIQYVAGKETTQLELYYTFDEIQNNGGQVVLASDRPLDEMPRLAEGLRSRFSGGLTVEITPPCFTERLLIAKRKAVARGLTLSPAEIRTVAKAGSDIRCIEGALNKIAFARRNEYAHH